MKIESIIESISSLNNYLTISKDKPENILSKFTFIDSNSASVINKLKLKLVKVGDSFELINDEHKVKLKVFLENKNKLNKQKKLNDTTLNKISQFHSDFDYVIFTDGSADNTNRTPVTSAFVIYKDGKELHSKTTTYPYLPKEESTNNSAEILGAVEAFTFILDNGLENSKICLIADSKLLIEYFSNRHWNNGKLEMGYYNSWLKLKKLVAQIPHFKRTWVGREYNTVADALTR